VSVALSPAAHTTGIALRHSRRCQSRQGSACSCTPTYQAQAWSAAERKPVRKTFPTLSAARAWRQEAQVALRRREMNAPSRVTVAQAASEWLALAEAGVIRNRSGDRYKPSALRSYRQALERHAVPELGRRRLSAVSRRRLQDLVDRLVASGRAPSSVRNAVLPLRAVYRRALASGLVVVNPTLELSLPAVRATGERIARPDEAEALIRALRPGDSALWATAIYAGLRRGELQALRWADVEFDASLLRVEHSWDRVAGLIEPKSRCGRRRVPLAGTLRTYLLEHRLRQGAGGEGFVLSATAERPFDPPTIGARARRAWSAAGLSPISLRECRHTYASLMIAAGINVKALSTYMGHSTITVTLDRYGHLLPGNEEEASTMLDDYLVRQLRESASPGLRFRRA
jgi:integrase